jgi:peptidoglycan hydrolase CwlO-like protein
MNKKIISILFLLIIFVSIAFAYSYLNQKETDQGQYDNSSKNVNDEDLSNEIDDMFIDENDELEIGEII